MNNKFHYFLLASLIGWLTIYVLSNFFSIPFFILISIFGFPFLILSAVLFVIGSIMLIRNSKVWLSSERILAILLLIPITLVLIAPLSKYIFDLYKVPTSETVYDFFYELRMDQNTEYDLSNTIISYNYKENTLILNIKINPQRFMETRNSFLDMRESSNDIDFANYIRNNLYLKYIYDIQSISELTRRPQKIVVHGFWGDEKIIDVFLKRSFLKYTVIKPYPDLKLILNNQKAYIYSDSYSKSIEIYETKKNDIQLEIDVFKTE